MLRTLQEVRESITQSFSGVCANSAEFTRLVNNASQRLLRRGDWPGTVVPIQVCSIGGCIVWPRYVGQVRKINICNNPVPMRNPWYEFLQYDNPRSWEGGYRNWNGVGGGNWLAGTSYGSWVGGQAWVTGGNETPVFQDIMGDGRLLRFYPQVQADVGKTVTVFGVDNNDQPLRHKLSDGTLEDGWVVTLTIPYASTTDYVRRIDRLVFQDHEGPVRAYAYNATDDVLEDVGYYEAHDNNPSFVRYRLNTGGPSCGGGSCGCSTSVIALVKLRYIPARYDTDLILIDNDNALGLMIQCLKYEQDGERNAARASEMDAIRELNLQLRDQFPEDQTSIGNGVFAGTGIGTQIRF